MTVLSTFSSSAVWEAVARGPVREELPPAGTVTLPDDALRELTGALATEIERTAVRIARRSRLSVDLMSGTGIYRHLADPEHRRAAEIAEIFRDGKVCANAGTLDVTALQHTVLGAVRQGEGLILELGWGQAKRSAGGLKTAGPDADLGETVALARLAAVTRAAGLLLAGQVVTRIIPGGSRFYEALFTRPGADRAYNDQREAVIAHLGRTDSVTLVRDRFDPADLRAALAEHAARPQPEPTAAELRFMQFAVDWDHVMELPDPPHGLRPPDRLTSAWRACGRPERNLLLRQLFTGALRTQRPARSCSRLVDDRTFEGSVEWMASVVRESAVKYARLGRITRREDTRPHDRDPRICRLTVVEKANRPEIPVMCLLGSRHGNHLPQNVVGIVQGPDSRVRFAPLVQVPGEHLEVRACLVPETPVPFFFTDLPWETGIETLRTTDLMDLA